MNTFTTVNCMCYTQKGGGGGGVCEGMSFSALKGQSATFYIQF